MWAPAPGTTWQWQLSGKLDLSVDAQLYDVDLFDAPAAAVRRLHARGTHVACYFSAGSYEPGRPDARRFPRSLRGRRLEGWPGERWLDIRRKALRPIMRARLDLCARKGFDAVEADNVDGYANRSGFRLRARDQLRYNRWLASAAHARGLSIGLKNDLGQIPELVERFDWALNEQCFEYGECSRLRPFVRSGKAVFVAEYRAGDFCARARRLGFMAMLKRVSLDAWRAPCW
jgi:hypothetical protein